MSDVTIPCEARTTFGTRPIRRLRKTGVIPAVLYGEGIETTSLQCKAKDLIKALRAGAHMVTLETPDGKHRVLVRDIQHDPVSDDVIHIDFHKVSLTEKLEIDVELTVKGEPEGAKTEGGVLEVPLHQLKIRALPEAIPDRIEIDVSALKLNERLRLKDITLPSGVEFVGSEETVLAACVPPREEPEEPEAAEAAATPGATEPEVIGKAKTEEEEGEKSE